MLLSLGNYWISRWGFLRGAYPLKHGSIVEAERNTMLDVPSTILPKVLKDRQMQDQTNTQMINERAFFIKFLHDTRAEIEEAKVMLDSLYEQETEIKIRLQKIEAKLADADLTDTELDRMQTKAPSLDKIIKH